MLGKASSSSGRRLSLFDVKTTKQPFALIACAVVSDELTPANGSAPKPVGRSTSANDPSVTSATAADGRAARATSPRARTRLMRELLRPRLRYVNRTPVRAD